jgi:transposase
MVTAGTVCLYGNSFLSGWHETHPDFRALDARLEPNHLARRIDALVDLLDLQPLLCSYRASGSTPFSPRLLLKAVLYELHLKQLCPAHWQRHARENEPLRWLLRGLTPSRARWYAFRDRLADCHEDLNRQILQLGFDLQLSTGANASLDGSTVAALGSRRRLDNAKSLPGKLAKLEAACSNDAQGLPLPADSPSWMAKTARGRLQQRERFRQASEVLEQRRRDNQQRRACDRVPDHQVRVCVSEPEAALGQDKEKVYRPLYNEQILRDLESPLILGYGVFAQASDVGTLASVVGCYQETFGERLQVLLADGAYATGSQARWTEERQITLYAPFEPPVSHKGQLPKTQFVFEGPGHGYVCPEGKRLVLVQKRTQQRGQGERVRLEVYQARREECASCPRRPVCCGKSKSGRSLSRSEYEETLERLQQRMATPEGKALYQQRKETVELALADQKEHRGLRRFRSRGLRRAGCQVGLLVLVHNGLIVQQALSKAQQPSTAPPPTA